MKNLRINPMVVSDLNEIRDYIAEDNPGAASKILKEYIADLRIYRCSLK